MRRFFVIALLAAIPLSAAAQRFSSSPHFAGRSFQHFGHAHGNFGASYYPLSLADPLYSDYLYDTGYPVASQPPVIMIQPPPAVASASERTTAPAQPLLIELQGNRYVQLSGENESGTQMLDDQTTSSVLTKPLDLRRVSQRESVNAILVFRDGSRAEVSDFTISNGVLYAAADYYTAGSWNRKIELSSLNLPETVKANQDRGVVFRLPSAPNELIVGP
jgi:hypothetical protein